MKKIIIFILFVILGTAAAGMALAQVNYASVPVGVFKSEGVLEIGKGTVSCWLKLNKGQRDRAQHVVFNTSDGRIVLYVDDYWSEKAQRKVLKISARAGGNQKVKGLFPEASLRIDNDGSLQEHKWISVPFPDDEWHYVAMTWSGHPQGTVSLFFDGKLMVTRNYDPSYDNGLELFNSFSVGFRSRNFPGQISKVGSGMLEEKPLTDMSLESGGIEMKDLRVYRRALKEEDIKGIFLEDPAGGS